MIHLSIPLEAGHFYHIYNRGINGETLFKEERNYAYFLSKYAQYLSPVVDTYAYCLLKNHFHLLIQVKDALHLKEFYFQEYPSASNYPTEGLHSPDLIVSKQFAKLFSSYTQAINKATSRTGALVESPFKRIEVKNAAYFSQLVWYIHYNPQKHGFVNDFRDYLHSSFHSHLQAKKTRLNRQEVLDWFGGEEAYRQYHATQKKENNIRDLLIELD